MNVKVHLFSQFLNSGALLQFVCHNLPVQILIYYICFNNEQIQTENAKFICAQSVLHNCDKLPCKEALFLLCFHI